MVDVGQNELTTVEGHEPKTFSRALRVPNFFREEPGRLIGRQAFRECTDQRGLAHSRESGDENVGSISVAVLQFSQLPLRLRLIAQVWRLWILMWLPS